MRYIGLDVSYRNVGVAILGHTDVGASLEHLQCKSPNDPEGFAWHLETAERTIKIGDVIAIEGLSFGSIGKTHVLAGAHAMWMKVAYERCRLLFVPVPVRVKIWATGLAKAKKHDMIAWAKTQVPWPKVSEHEADALALAEMARSGYTLMEHGLDPKLTPRRLEILYNTKQNGLTQVENRSFYRGRNG